MIAPTSLRLVAENNAVSVACKLRIFATDPVGTNAPVKALAGSEVREPAKLSAPLTAFEMAFTRVCAPVGANDAPTRGRTRVAAGVADPANDSDPLTLRNSDNERPSPPAGAKPEAKPRATGVFNTPADNPASAGRLRIIVIFGRVVLPANDAAPLMLCENTVPPPAGATRNVSPVAFVTLVNVIDCVVEPIGSDPRVAMIASTRGDVPPLFDLNVVHPALSAAPDNTAPPNQAAIVTPIQPETEAFNGGNAIGLTDVPPAPPVVKSGAVAVPESATSRTAVRVEFVDRLSVITEPESSARVV